MKYNIPETEAEAIIAQENGCEVETGYCFRECGRNTDEFAKSIIRV